MGRKNPDQGGSDWLAERFEAERGRLRAVAYRMLGSAAEAEDAVQETWLRLARADSDGIDNLGGFLTTVIARICLDMLRARKSRHEEPIDEPLPDVPAGEEASPERDRLLADSVGVAMLVVLDRLAPAERVAFVLHDMFDLPFETIAPIVGRTPAAARQLASRARRRVQGTRESEGGDPARRRAVVEAFLAASRRGDFEALLTVLDPDVVFRADAVAVEMGGPAELRGAAAVAELFKGKAQAAKPALVEGEPGVAVAFHGRLRIVLRLAFDGERIAGIETVADPAHLKALDVTILG